MDILIKRIDPSLPLPAYHTTGSAGFDIYARETIEIAPHTIARIPTNLVIQTPAHHMLVISLRSSTPMKKGLSIPHGIGVIDSDYCGDQDEILLQVINHTDNATTVERGERIGQGIFIPIITASWQEVSTMQSTNRGGFGSTGV